MTDEPKKRTLSPRVRALLAIAYRRARARRSVERRRMLDFYEDLTDGLDDAEREAAGDQGIDPDVDE
jgi:hypothetical protein